MNKALIAIIWIIAILSLCSCLILVVEETSTLLTWSKSGILRTTFTTAEDSTFIVSKVDSTEFLTRPVPDSGDVVLVSPDTSDNVRIQLRKIYKGEPPGTRVSFDYTHEGDTLAATIETQPVKASDRIASAVLETLRFLSIVGFFIVGLWAFVKRPNSGAIRALSLFCFSMGGFLIGSITIGYNDISGIEVPYGNYIKSSVRLLALFFGVFWLNLQLLFPRPGKFVAKHPIPAHLLVYLPNLFILAVAIFGIFEPITSGAIIMSVIMFQIALGFIILGINYGKARDSLEKRQTRLVLWGSGIGLSGLFGLTIVALVFTGWFANLGTNVVLSLISLIFLGLIIIPMSFAYAFGKYRLLEVEGRLRRGTRFAMITVFLLVIFYAAIYGVSETLLNSFDIESRAPALMLALVLAIGFTPAQKKIQSFAESKFYPERNRLRRMLLDFLGQASTFADKSEFWNELENHLKLALNVDRIHPVLYDDQQDRFIDLRDNKAAPFARNGRLIDELNQCRACPLMLDEALASDKLKLPDEDMTWLKARDILMVLPLQTRSRVVGMIGLGLKAGRKDFDIEECGILMSLASQAAVVADNLSLLEDNIEKQRLEKELAMARTVQHGLLPGKIPEIPGLEIAAQSKFCLEVAGDYYDVIKIDDRRTVVAIGDVSGKGAAAALLMSNIQASFRTAVGLGSQYTGDGSGPTISDIIYRINNLIHNNTAPADFITFFVGIYDSGEKSFEYVNAGHNQPMLFRRSGEIEYLDKGGLLLGAIADVPYEQGLVNLHSGDLVFLYTDGVSEAINSKNEMFGEDRILKSIIDNRQLPAERILSGIEKEVTDFTEGIPLTDDFTMMALRVG